MLFQLKFAVAFLVLSAAIVAADDVSQGQDSHVNSKWLYGGFGIGGWGGYGMWSGWLGSYWGLGSYYGFGYLPYYNSLWFKSDEASSQSERRSLGYLSLEPRGDTNQHAFECKNSKGQAEQFILHHCNRAANKLASEKGSSATCGSCTLSLVGSDGKLSASKIPATELEKVASSILKGCADPKSVPAAGNTGNTKGKSVALLLSKGDGGPCA